MKKLLSFICANIIFIFSVMGVYPLSAAAEDDEFSVAMQTGYKVSVTQQEKTVSGFTLGDKVGDIRPYSKEATAVFYKNSIKANEQDNIATGMTLKIFKASQLTDAAQVVLLGDVNGDGSSTATDLLCVKGHLLNVQLLQGCYYQAGKITGGDDVSAADMLKLKRVILGIDSIMRELPITYNTAVLYNKKSSSYDAAAEQVRLDIVNSANQVMPSVSGTTYYISYKGDDNNSGTSTAAPWKTAANLNNTSKFKAGDVVLFERGGVYRDVSFVAQSGVNYGAYGYGPKPALYGSRQNYADTSLWSATDKPNVWRIYVGKEMEDIGNFVMDHGKACAAFKKLSNTLTSDFEFYHDTENGYAYVYLSAGNPAAIYSDIEICSRRNVISGHVKNVVIDNLCIKYTGAHGIGLGNLTNVTVQNCEVGYIGGSMLDPTVRYGNGVELYGECDGFTVKNNWIYQCYDAGITNQHPTGYHTNVDVSNNLVEYCLYNIEVWTEKTVGMGGLVNCVYENNILRFAGFGFGTTYRIGSNSSATAHISMYDFVVPSQNSYIRNNVFDTAYRYLVSVYYANDPQGRGPVITSNTYIQQPYSNGDTTAVVAQLNGHGVLKCVDQLKMEQSVEKIDANPNSVILETK